MSVYKSLPHHLFNEVVLFCRHQVFRPKLIEYVRKRKLKKHKQVYVCMRMCVCRIIIMCVRECVCVSIHRIIVHCSVCVLSLIIINGHLPRS